MLIVEERKYAWSQVETQGDLELTHSDVSGDRSLEAHCRARLTAGSDIREQHLDLAECLELVVVKIVLRELSALCSLSADPVAGHLSLSVDVEHLPVAHADPGKIYLVPRTGFRRLVSSTALPKMDLAETVLSFQVGQPLQ